MNPLVAVKVVAHWSATGLFVRYCSHSTLSANVINFVFVCFLVRALFLCLSLHAILFCCLCTVSMRGK